MKHRGEKRLEWPKDQRHPDYIKLERPAVYECLHCQAEIEQGKLPAMLALGNWLPEGYPLELDGSMPPPPLTSHVGYPLERPEFAFCHSGRDRRAIIGRSKRTGSSTRPLSNLWLGLPWKEMVKPREASALLELRTARPALEVPDNTLALTAGIDNQRRGLLVLHLGLGATASSGRSTSISSATAGSRTSPNWRSGFSRTSTYRNPGI